MMLIREGEGEGARDDTTLDTRELADISQFWSRSSSSSFVGPLLMFSASMCVHTCMYIFTYISTHECVCVHECLSVRNVCMVNIHVCGGGE